MTTVLLADDEPETLAGWEHACVSEGYEVFTARDGEEALAILNARDIDIVVADWHMPRMSGGALCHRIRSEASLAKKVFILVSGELTPPAFVHYDCYLRKPVTMGSMFAVMRRLEGVNQPRKIEPGRA